jgi:hypothetical protein
MFLLSACSWALLCCRPFLTNWVISWPHHGLGFALPIIILVIFIAYQDILRIIHGSQLLK